VPSGKGGNGRPNSCVDTSSAVPMRSTCFFIELGSRRVHLAGCTPNPRFTHDFDEVRKIGPPDASNGPISSRSFPPICCLLRRHQTGRSTGSHI
jgi:hypothetical protein